MSSILINNCYLLLTRTNTGLQTAVSPNFCSLVQMAEDGKVKWHGVKYTLAEPGAQTDGQSDSEGNAQDKIDR